MIGYYVHHHGKGHLARAQSVAAALGEHTGEPVVALASMTPPAQHPFAGWLQLADDPHLDAPREPDAGGALHWAPLNSTGYRERMALVAGWATTARPRLVVVDVSVEVTIALRALGVPVVVAAMPGVRADEPHTLAYRAASAVVAPWSSEVYRPAHLAPFAAKTHYVGAISRFDGRCSRPPSGSGRVLALFGTGGGGASAQDLAAIGAHSGRECVGLGGSELPWHDDVWAQLEAADVVVTHAGQNVLAEVAAARRPAVVVAQQRPFEEQVTTARVLHAAGIVTAPDGWPDPEAWPGLLDEAVARGGEGWKRWHDHHGAQRFAEVLASSGPA